MALHATPRADTTAHTQSQSHKALHTLRAHAGCACLPAGYCGYSVC
jgi:hypothetical protein